MGFEGDSNRVRFASLNQTLVLLLSDEHFAAIPRSVKCTHFEKPFVEQIPSWGRTPFAHGLGPLGCSSKGKPASFRYANHACA